MTGQHRRSPVVLFSLLIVFLIVALALAVAATMYIASVQFSVAASPRTSPLSAVQAGAIDPALAVLSLAGTPDDAVVDKALASGSGDTALATLLYSTSLSDQVRAASLLALAHRLAQDGKKDDALVAGRTAADVATLSPVMSDYSRAAVLDQAGQIMAGAGKQDEAAHAYGIASTIAEYSGRIDPTYRQLLLDALATDLSHIGRADQARTVRSSMQSATLTSGNSPAVLPTMLLPLDQSNSPVAPDVWASVDAATAERVSLAAKLVSSLQRQSGTPPETVRQSLEQALIKEDALRDQVYSRGIAESDNLLQRAAYARARLEWQTLKWRVARQGFGMSLVPAWESQISANDASLRKAYDDYFAIMRDVAASLPEQVDAAQGDIDVILDQIKMGRLGLPPGSQESALLQALNNAVDWRQTLGGANLYVTTQKDNNTSQLTVVTIQ